VRVPLADLQAQYATIRGEIDAAVQRVLASGHYILGEDVAALEGEVAADHAIAHAVGVSSGSDALLAALWAIGVGPGDEVITPALSFFASAGAIARLGATPVFADIDPATFDLDPASALARITPRTKAILPVHLYGRPADVTSLRTADLPIVEDAAQAYGYRSASPGERIHTEASAGEPTRTEDPPAVASAPESSKTLATLSFFPTKNLGAAGDAGMVLCADPEIADRIRLYRTHGARPKYVHHVVGANLRMDTLQAAILRVKRRHVTAWIATRRANAARYRELLADTPLVLPTDTPHHVWHHFVVRVPASTSTAPSPRDELRAFLAAREIETEVYYPRALHLQPCFGGREGEHPEAERATREVLALPIHAELSRDQLAFVADAIRAFS
jgi:dTDP-4-amino-4,6-dideoxygalactose transaminase